MIKRIIILTLFLSGCMSSIKKESKIVCKEDEVLVCKKIEPKVELYRLRDDEITFFKNDWDESFKRAYELNLKYLTSNLDKNIYYDFGSRKVDYKTILKTAEKINEIMMSAKKENEFNKAIRENFDVYELKKGTDSVIFSSYYEPVFEATLLKDDLYKYPIYRKPDDMYEINLEDFDPSNYKGQKLTGRIIDKKLVPYYSRQEIDFDGIFKDKGYEIAYLKNITDVLDLQTQGSGILKLKNGGYKRAKFAATNSLKFKGWMSYLIEKGYLKREGEVGKDKTFYERAINFINSRQDLWREVFGSNKRYSFFYLDDLKSFDEGPIGTYGLNLVGRRSIAVDTSIIPLGIIGYINVNLPDIDDNLNIVGFSNKQNFVFAHDTGGAIKGARVDYFAGTGDLAKKFAYSVWERGNLYILLIKDNK